MYKYEMHCHTAIMSRCGKFTPEELVSTYKSQGFTGVVVTDHFFNGNCAADKSLPWKERVKAYCLAYEKVKEEGDKAGLDVFFGFEYSCNNNAIKDQITGTDFLIYGLDKEWLLSKGDYILDMPVNDFMKMVKEEGGLVVQAHPFRLEKSYMDHISLFPDYTEAVEILNGNPNTIGRGNRLAEKYAKEYGFYTTAGTDAHSSDVKYFAVLMTKKRAETIEDIINEIRSRKVKLKLIKNKLNG